MDREARREYDTSPPMRHRHRHYHRYIIDVPKRSYRVVDAFRAVPAVSEGVPVVDSSEGPSLPLGLMGLPVPSLEREAQDALVHQPPAWPPVGRTTPSHPGIPSTTRDDLLTAHALLRTPSPDSRFWASLTHAQSPTSWLSPGMFESMFEQQER